MSYNILLIDDSLYSLTYHSELVTAVGHIPLTAISGPDGCDLYQKKRPDFVLCDIMMPEMDGYEVFSELKGLDSSVVLYFVTAEVSDHAIQKANNMNAAGIFAKPIDLPVIKKIVEKFEEKKLVKN